MSAPVLVLAMGTLKQLTCVASNFAIGMGANTARNVVLTLARQETQPTSGGGGGGKQKKLRKMSNHKKLLLHGATTVI